MSTIPNKAGSTVTQTFVRPNGRPPLMYLMNDTITHPAKQNDKHIKYHPYWKLVYSKLKTMKLAIFIAGSSPKETEILDRYR